jgi:hypothetical protein
VTAHFLVDQKMCRLRRRIHEEEDTCKYPAVINTHTHSILLILVNVEALGTIADEHAASPTLTNEVIPQPTHPPLPQPTHQVKLAPEMDLHFSHRSCERDFFGESWGLRELVYLL